MVPRQTRYCTIFGICLGVFSLIFGIFWEKIFYKFVEKNLVLKNGSLIYELWHKPPLDIQVDFYLFNWTNPEDFRNPAIKPKFEELGPYSYKETQEKVDIKWNVENGTVSYHKKSFYHYIGNGTRNSLDDVVTTINSIAVTAATIAQHLSSTKRTLAEFGMMVYPRDLTIQKTADELLFAGYKDTLLSIINTLPVSTLDIPYDKYGYGHGRNNSKNFYGPFNVHTGAKDFKTVGQMNTWNYKNHSDYYTSQCSKVKGSAGEFMGPYLKPEDTISIFARELCRDLPLEFEDIIYYEGIKSFKYVAGLKAIDNGTLYKENACLCNGECLPSGVMNITSCWFNSPVFISYPHFYKADPYYLSQLDGLEPQQQKHEFTYILEPKIGIPLEVIGRSQMNILIQPIQRSRMFHDVRKIMFPLCWVEARARLTPELLDYFKLIANIISCGQLVAGALCIFGFIIAFFYPILYKIRYRLVPQSDKQIFDEKHNFSEVKTFAINQNLEFDFEKKEIEITRDSRQGLL